MKTEMIKSGVGYNEEDYNQLIILKKDETTFLKKYLLNNDLGIIQISKVLADLNNTDGGGPIVKITDLKGKLAFDNLSGKVDIHYQLNLEWGCDGIKKELLKSEKFDVEFDLENKRFFLYLFINNS